MSKIILMLLLAVFCKSAMADWVLVDKSTDGSMAVYANPITKRKAGKMVKMWVLTNYKEAQVIEGVKPFLSTKIQQEYDCKEEKLRKLAYIAYSGNIGGGSAIYQDSVVSDWLPVSPDSTGEVTYLYACGKK